MVDNADVATLEALPCRNDLDECGEDSSGLGILAHAGSQSGFCEFRIRQTLNAEVVAIEGKETRLLHGGAQYLLVIGPQKLEFGEVNQEAKTMLDDVELATLSP